MPIVYIADLVEYRLANEKLVECIAQKKIEIFGEEVTKRNYVDHIDRVHKVLIFGDISTTANVKFHNIGLDVNLIIDSSRFDNIQKSLAYLKENGGVLIFLDTKTISKEQAKEFGVGAQILKDLGIEHIKLLTENIDTEFIGLSGFGLNVVNKTRL